MSGWIKVCALDEIAPQGSRVVASSQGDIAIFRTDDDRVFGLHDKCPHKGGPLSQGIVAGERVTCPLHGWLVELASGHAVAPDQGCVKRHEARVDAGKVLIRLA
jgi:nitrite reductase (NADH) small subunit